MAIQIQLRKGTATEHNTFTGANGEVTVDTTNKTLRVHDGSTVGGTRIATLTGGLVPSAQLPVATTSTQGIVKLNNTVTSTDATQALTAAQGKVLKDTLDTVASSSLGVGQDYVDKTSSRVIGTSYINTGLKPRTVIYIAANSSTDANAAQISKDNINWVSVGLSLTPVPMCNTFIVPPNWYYKFNRSITSVVELD
jgi:hypothetical protein